VLPPESQGKIAASFAAPQNHATLALEMCIRKKESGRFFEKKLRKKLLTWGHGSPQIPQGVAARVGPCGLPVALLRPALKTFP
jgi:hypothetical protein